MRLHLRLLQSLFSGGGDAAIVTRQRLALERLAWLALFLIGFFLGGVWNREPSVTEGAEEMESRSRLADLLRQSQVSETRLKVELSTIEGLTGQVKALEKENLQLKEDLKVLEAEMGGAGRSLRNEVRVERLRVIPAGASGRYSYRFILLASDPRSVGQKLELVIAVQTLAGGQNGMITFPPEGSSASDRRLIELRSAQRLEGEFSLPSGHQPVSVEIRLQDRNGIKLRKSVAPVFTS